MRIVALLEGEFYNCSVDHVEIPDDMDLEELNRQYYKWYNKEYRPALKRGNMQKYLTFVDFLKNNGATDTDKVEKFDYSS